MDETQQPLAAASSVSLVSSTRRDDEDVIVMFRLRDVCALLKRYGLTKAVLQFPEDVLSYCVAVYNAMRLLLADEQYVLYIVADSTFGSSLDDVSAMHLSSPTSPDFKTMVIVYFGSDLSSGGTIPVCVVPRVKHISSEIKNDCIRTLTNHLLNSPLMHVSGGTDGVVLVCDPSYYATVEQLLSTFVGDFQGITFRMGRLPVNAYLEGWSPDVTETSNADNVTIGGLVVDNSTCILSDSCSSASEIWYFGSKREQVASIFLNYSQLPVVIYDPVSNS
jgi:diphthamide biosynthesis enzyme Dph1/Dph2-like protein